MSEIDETPYIFREAVITQALKTTEASKARAVHSVQGEEHALAKLITKVKAEEGKKKSKRKKKREKDKSKPSADQEQIAVLKNRIKNKKRIITKCEHELKLVAVRKQVEADYKQGIRGSLSNQEKLFQCVGYYSGEPRLRECDCEECRGDNAGPWIAPIYIYRRHSRYLWYDRGCSEGTDYRTPDNEDYRPRVMKVLLPNMVIAASRYFEAEFASKVPTYGGGLSMVFFDEWKGPETELYGIYGLLEGFDEGGAHWCDVHAATPLKGETIDENVERSLDQWFNAFTASDSFRAMNYIAEIYGNTEKAIEVMIDTEIMRKCHHSSTFTTAMKSGLYATEIALDDLDRIR